MLQFTTLSHWMVSLRDRLFGVQPTMVPLSRPPLSQLAHLPVKALPKFVQDCPEAMKVLALLGDLDWEHFPERPSNCAWRGPTPAPRAPCVAAYLVKLEADIRTFGKLREHLIKHPALAGTGVERLLASLIRMALD